jgi:hypothetical protein
MQSCQTVLAVVAATERNEIDAVRCLCLAGLDLNLTNADGLTAEQLAIALKHTNIANLLSSLRRVSRKQEESPIYLVSSEKNPSSFSFFFFYSLLNQIIADIIETLLTVLI